MVYEGDLAFFKKDYPACYEALKKAVTLKRPPNFEPYRELEKLANVSAMLLREQVIDMNVKDQIYSTIRSPNGRIEAVKDPKQQTGGGTPAIHRTAYPAIQL